jgi:hypothetical protein
MRFLFRNAILSLFIGVELLGVSCFFQVHAQPLLYSVQAHHAMAASIGKSDRHPFSVVVNPASVADFRKIAWAFGGEQRFLAPGWTSWAAAAILPVVRGSWSFVVAEEGLPILVDQLVMFTHARAVSNQALFGVSLGFNRRKAGSFTAVVAPAIAAGFTFSLSSEWQTGFSYARFVRQRATSASSGDLSVLRYTLGYQTSEKFLIGAGVTKESGRAAVGSVSLCYRPSLKAGFRVGFSSSPSLCWFGLLLGIGKKVVVQVHSGFYSLVGVSNGLSVFSDPAITTPNPSIQ